MPVPNGGVGLAVGGINRRTVSRHLTLLGLDESRFIDPDGENNRMPGKIIARWPGHMVHLDVKKVGRIPDGGGWRIHGRDSDQAKVATELDRVMSGCSPDSAQVASVVLARRDIRRVAA
ncbi:hypothetical protein ACWD3J_49655 [Streptomyces sp. NPDC002755]|uniref:hypothetical protein n=1 Tax=Streptomyces sp. NPDC002884 TaxID=3154544 RepID=UPI0033270D92